LVVGIGTPSFKDITWKKKKNIISQAPYKPECNMPRQAVPALIGKYKIMPLHIQPGVLFGLLLLCGLLWLAVAE
jgi:hypothetical protein